METVRKPALLVSRCPHRLALGSRSAPSLPCRGGGDPRRQKDRLLVTKVLKLGEGVLGALLLHGHVLLSWGIVVLGLAPVQGLEVWLWGEDGAKPPLLSS